MSFQRYLDEMRSLRQPELGNLILLEQVGSTNRLARRITEEGLEEGVCPSRSWIVAHEQTQGRGRQGHTWVSPPGAGVYATLILPLSELENSTPAAETATPLTTLPLLAAVAVCQAVDSCCDLALCRLQWPNDLMIERAKLGGVLIEILGSAGDERIALVGFGVNYLAEAASDLDRATSGLCSHCSQPPSLAELTWELLSSVNREMTHFGDTSHAIASYQELSSHQLGESLRCRVGDHHIEGLFKGFDERGFLRLEVDGEERLLAAGEVAEP